MPESDGPERVQLAHLHFCASFRSPPSSHSACCDGLSNGSMVAVAGASSDLVRRPAVISLDESYSHLLSNVSLIRFISFMCCWHVHVHLSSGSHQSWRIRATPVSVSVWGLVSLCQFVSVSVSDVKFDNAICVLLLSCLAGFLLLTSVSRCYVLK